MMHVCYNARYEKEFYVAVVCITCIYGMIIQ